MLLQVVVTQLKPVGLLKMTTDAYSLPCIGGIFSKRNASNQNRKLKEVDMMKKIVIGGDRDETLFDKLKIGWDYFLFSLKERLSPFDSRIVREVNEEYRRLSRGELWMKDKDEYGVIRILWKFGERDAFNQWDATSDYNNYGGYSTCTFMQTSHNTALFSGYLNTEVPKDGITTQAGYCNIASRRMFEDRHIITVSYDWRRYFCFGGYTHMVIRCRGDGRSYMLNLHIQGGTDIDRHDMFNYLLYTRGGPYWQVTKIPLTKFLFSNRSYIQDIQFKIGSQSVTQISITLADGNVGNFSLEIDYIGVIFDPLDEGIFDYEQYETNLAWRN